MDDVLDRLTSALAERYRIDREIGRGGMAIVLLAEDLKHRRLVALKVLRPEIAHSVGAARFLEEIRLSAQLNHPLILPLLDSGDVREADPERREAPSLVYYVMPYVEGGTLRDRMSREGEMSIEAVLAITNDVAEALAYAHSRGVLHRDIKPENILLTPRHALISDFGIARAIEAAGGARLTESGIAVGTPMYMSPEQSLAERDLDGRSDLYSLACVTYEMLAGEPPFTGPTLQAVLARRLAEPPRSIRATRSSVKPRVDAAIARALAPARGDRFASVEQFAAALQPPRDVASMTTSATMPVVTSGVRRRWLAPIIIAAVLGLAASGLWLRQRSTPSAPAPGEPPRLAVLPLENMGGADDAPFAAGISEEITSRLAQIGALRVVARTSAKLFSGREKRMSEIGRELDAEYILDGTVRTDRTAGGVGRARVTMQLIRAAADETVWQDDFDASLVPGDIFRVQADIASRVAAALNLTLGEPERRQIERVATRDSTAYRLYQLGRFSWEKRDAESLLRARQYFSEAIARDSSFAEAYAGFADATNAYVLLFGTGPGRVDGAPGIAAARRAIAINNTLAAAHAALGFALTFFDWSYPAADSALTRAIALDAEYGPSRYWYTQLLWVEDRLTDALEQSRQGVAVDPLSGVAHLAYSRTLRLTGKADEAFAELNRAIELQPNLWVPYVDLAEYYAARRQPDRAADAVRRYLTTAYPNHLVRDEDVRALVQIFSGQGEGNASQVVRRLRSSGITLQPGTVARWFALTGQADSAFAHMQRAIDTRSPDVATVVPFLRPILGTDPRWAALERSVGLTSGVATGPS